MEANGDHHMDWTEKGDSKDRKRTLVACQVANHNNAFPSMAWQIAGDDHRNPQPQAIWHPRAQTTQDPQAQAAKNPQAAGISWGSGMSRVTAHIGDFGNTGGWGSSTEHAANFTGDRDCGCSGSEFPQKSQSTVTISGDSLWDGVLMNTKFKLWRGHLGSTVNSFCVSYQLRNGKHCLFHRSETPIQSYHCLSAQKHPKYFTVDCFRDCRGRLYYWVSEKHQTNIIICSRNRKLGYWPAHKYRTHFLYWPTKKYKTHYKIQRNTLQSLNEVTTKNMFWTGRLVFLPAGIKKEKQSYIVSSTVWLRHKTLSF